MQFVDEQSLSRSWKTTTKLSRMLDRGQSILRAWSSLGWSSRCFLTHVAARRERGWVHECARASARVGARQRAGSTGQQKKRQRNHQRDVTAGVAGVETSRPSGQAPAIIVGTYGNNHSDPLCQTTSSGPAASSEMVLHMLDTLMTGHEPFYADYPSYQETDPLTHPHHQHPHQHAIARNTGMPPVSLDATTHTPGTRDNSLLRPLTDTTSCKVDFPLDIFRDFNANESTRNDESSAFGDELRGCFLELSFLGIGIFILFDNLDELDVDERWLDFEKDVRSYWKRFPRVWESGIELFYSSLFFLILTWTKLFKVKDDFEESACFHWVLYWIYYTLELPYSSSLSMILM